MRRGRRSREMRLYIADSLFPEEVTTAAGAPLHRQSRTRSGGEGGHNVISSHNVVMPARRPRRLINHQARAPACRWGEYKESAFAERVCQNCGMVNLNPSQETGIIVGVWVRYLAPG